MLEDIKNVLSQQQEGIQAMVQLMKEDAADLSLVEELAQADRDKGKAKAI